MIWGLSNSKDAQKLYFLIIIGFIFYVFTIIISRMAKISAVYVLFFLFVSSLLLFLSLHHHNKKRLKQKFQASELKMHRYNQAISKRFGKYGRL